MKMSKVKPKQPKQPSKLVEKYAGKSAEEMESDQEQLMAEYNERCQAMEHEISDFSTKTDEMKNPTTGKVMAIVKRPTTNQWKQMVPKELMKYTGKDKKEIPIEVAEKYEELIYDVMAELIVEPKHDAKWWKDHTGYEFVQAFQSHMISIFDEMEKNIGNF